MKIVMTGGGSGGHITPILAVAREVKLAQPDTEITYVGERGDSLADVPAADPSIDNVASVRAGKLRRYHDQGYRQLLDLPTVARNIRDMVYVLVGIGQSIRLLRRLKPDVIFIKGGFVGVPIGLAAAILRISYITHDSDAIPGLANRIISRWATWHTVALPEQVYNYPRAKTMTVGVPISRQYQTVTNELRNEYRRALQLPDAAQLVFVTGGGNGARALNEAVVANAAYLLKRYPALHIIHLSGRSLEVETKAAYKRALQLDAIHRVTVLGFVNDLYRYSGAADVIIGRGSATNLAEFAVQAKACIIIPAAQLAWTVRNTEILARQSAVIALTEDQAGQEQRLGRVVAELLDNPVQRADFGRQLASFGRSDAAQKLAVLLLNTAKRPVS